MIRIWLCVALATVASPALAEEKPGFDISAAVRLRYEVIDGQARAGLPASEDLVNLRTIVRTRYRTGPVTLALDLWDSRVFVAGRPSAVSTNEVNGLEPMQANVAVDFKAPGAITGKLTAGRMIVELGSSRLIANDDYRNTTNGFTGARLDLSAPHEWSATLLYLLPQQRLPTDADGLRSGRPMLDHEGIDTRLWGAFVQRGHVLGPVSLDATILRFEERDRPGNPTRDRQLTTFGGHAFIAPKPGRWDIDVEGFRQSGRTRTSLASTAPERQVDAWFLHAETGYKFSLPAQPHLSLEFDYASGDRGRGRYGRFDTLYGMRRRDFSPAGLLSAIGRGNIESLGGRVEVTPSKRLDAFASVRKLWLASRYDSFSTTGVIDRTGQSGRDAGWEIDSRVRYWLVPGRFQLEGDAVWIAKGRFLATAPNRSSSGDTHYLSLNATAFF